MTKACRQNEILLSLRAAGALDDEEAARLEGHLVLCSACRAEAEELSAAIDLARLPPPSEAERRTFGDVGERTLAALRRSARVRSIAKRTIVTLAAAAAAALVLLAPAVIRRGSPPDGGAPAWQLPDMETIWSDASALDVDWGSGADVADASQGQGLDQGDDDTETDATLAALEL
jgi:anti-sigma factor RsiW